MFTIGELFDYKEKAEKAVVMAQARVAVAEELIALAQSRCQEEQMSVSDIDCREETNQFEAAVVDGTL